MSPLTSTRTKRRTVLMVLLVWLFALGSGWANACLLQERGTHWLGPTHTGADFEQAKSAGTTKGDSLKVCSDDTQTIVTLTSSVGLMDVALAPPAALTSCEPLDAAEQANAWLALPPPGTGVPLRTLYSRLTL